ncbi:Hypp1321 [Branchiostoma lanceolatum]|uniref:Hypp1321 protein n=1 Tax=Branchiostoma lanceolatum TaxID=7740 RepID=A0A8K0EK12_BRALA|nr:Hypp1321 [Branchiostoma lanceolatum]
MQLPGTTLRHATVVLVVLCIAVTIAHVRGEGGGDTAALFNRLARDDKSTNAKLKHIIPLRFGKKWANFDDAAPAVRPAYGSKPTEDGGPAQSHRVHSKPLPLIQLLQYAVRLMEEVIQGLEMEQQGGMP